MVVITAASMATPGWFETKLGGKSESQSAQDLLRERFPTQAGDTATVAFRSDGPVSSDANRAAIGTTLARLRGLPHVAGVRSSFASPVDMMRSVATTVR